MSEVTGIFWYISLGGAIFFSCRCLANSALHKVSVSFLVFFYKSLNVLFKYLGPDLTQKHLQRYARLLFLILLKLVWVLSYSLLPILLWLVCLFLASDNAMSFLTGTPTIALTIFVPFFYLMASKF